MKYDIVYQFTKKGNLLGYFHENSHRMNIQTEQQYDRWHEYYAQEREINLYAMTRVKYVPDDRCHLLCQIKCPTNPLPVKGEFELPCEGALFKFLRENGWEFKQKIPLHMFE